MSTPWPAELSEQVAVLRERTEPKPKSVIQNIQAWSGVMTAVIALLYTIPLGVWDRWFESHAQAEARKLDGLRSAIVQLAELEARALQGWSEISDPSVKTMFGNAIGAQRAATLFRVADDMKKYSARLSVPELILVGYNLGLGGRITEADEIYSVAINVAANTGAPVSFRADIHRMRGLLHSSHPTGANLAVLRDSYRQNIALLLSVSSQTAQPSLPIAQQLLHSTMELAIFELTLPGGNRPCGGWLGDWTHRRIAELPAMPSVEQQQALFMTRVAPMLAGGNLTAEACGLPLVETLAQWRVG